MQAQSVRGLRGRVWRLGNHTDVSLCCTFQAGACCSLFFTARTGQVLGLVEPLDCRVNAPRELGGHKQTPPTPSCLGSTAENRPS